MKRVKQHITQHICVKIAVSVILLLPEVITLYGQSNFAIVDKIEIIGNKKTKQSIIFRELDLSLGDTIHLDQLTAVLERNEANLINTSLFTSAKINLKDWDTDLRKLTLFVEVQEIFYILPVPIFELADRNFSVWWTEQNRSLARVNYGARVYHNNLSGHQDRLKLVAQFGFTKKYEIVYSQPYLNKAQTIGISTGLLYSTQNNVPYITIANKRNFADFDDQKVLTRLNLRLGATYRPNYLWYHNVTATYQKNTVLPNIIDSLNASFFADGESRQRFFSMSYEISHDTRNIKVFPTKGSRSELKLTKDGLTWFDDVNLLFLEAKHERYTVLSPRWSLMTTVKGRAELTGNRPTYYQNRGLGFGQDYIRGYELYVLDGQYYAYLRSGLRYNLIKSSINLKKMMPLRQMRHVPINLFVDVHIDTGVAHDRFYGADNPLSNHLLGGYGVGLDLLLYNNYLFELDLTFNRLGEYGIYFQYNVDF